MKNILCLDHVQKHFRHGTDVVKAVDDVCLNIHANEFFTLLGPSGCGKTTLLRLIAGLDMIDQGRILLDEQDISAIPAHRRPVNTVFQSYALFPHMTVAENIAFGLAMQKKPATEIKSSVAESLHLVRMDTLADRKPSQLSGGQQQRVALARALVNRPKILLLDESLSALDYKLRKEMQIELKRLQRDTGITFIFVTHDQDEALSMSDRIAVMHKGRVAQLGSPGEIYEKPANRFVADFIGICNFVRASSLGLSGDNDVGFRPEDVHIVTSPPPGHAAGRGKIRYINYRGPVTHYLVDLDSGEQITVAGKSPSAGMAANSSILLSVPLEKIITCTA